MFNKLQEAVPSPVGPNETFLLRITMKYAKLLNLLMVVMALSLGVVGCHPKKGIVTPIPGQTQRPGGPGDTFGKEPGTGTQLPPEQPPTVKPGPGGEFPLERRFDPERMNQDRERFAANTVYFDFDRAPIKP